MNDVVKAVSDTPTPAAAAQEDGWAVDWAHGQGRENYVPELRGMSGLLRLEKMANTDETVGSMMWMMATTICQIPWTFTPCFNGQEVSREHPKFEEATKYADFAQSCLEDMNHSWGEHLEEALTMGWAGFAPCEITFKKRDGEDSRFEDGKWGFKGLPLRDQTTIWDWIPDPKTNELIGMRQLAAAGKTADVPLWKVLHYRMSAVLDNPWGKSMLTNAWRPYYLKNRIQESEAIGIDRELCGLPMFRLPKSEMVAAQETDANGEPTPKALAARRRIQNAEKAVRTMRFNEVGGLTLPSDVYMDEDGKPSSVKMYDFEIVKSSGARAIDARTAARDYDRAIARTILMQFLHLGDRSGGSYGLSENQSDVAIRSMRWVANKIRDEFNLKAIPLLWLMNADPKAFMPKLECGNLADESIAVLGQFLESMAAADILFYDDPGLKDAAFERAGLRAARRQITDVKSKPRPEPEQGSLFPSTKPANGNKPSASRSGGERSRSRGK